VRERLADNPAGSGLGPWYLAKAKALSVGLSNASFKSLGLSSLLEDCQRTSRTAVYGPVRTVVWQRSANDRRPYADLVACSDKCSAEYHPA
jgi:hypothetical protein